jgi:hypothetical protein
MNAFVSVIRLPCTSQIEQGVRSIRYNSRCVLSVADTLLEEAHGRRPYQPHGRGLRDRLNRLPNGRFAGLVVDQGIRCPFLHDADPVRTRLLAGHELRGAQDLVVVADSTPPVLARTVATNYEVQRSSTSFLT